MDNAGNIISESNGTSTTATIYRYSSKYSGNSWDSAIGAANFTYDKDDTTKYGIYYLNGGEYINSIGYGNYISDGKGNYLSINVDSNGNGNVINSTAMVNGWFFPNIKDTTGGTGTDTTVTERIYTVINTNRRSK